MGTKKAIFVGQRIESCRAFSSIMKHYGYVVDIITFKDSFIAKAKEEFDNIKVILDYDKGICLDYLYDLMTKNEYEILLSVGFPYILSEKFLALKTIFINSHPHLLPDHKGNNAIRESFEAKEHHYGVTVHYMTKQVDSGEIILQKEVDFDPTDIEAIYVSLFSCIEPAAVSESLTMLLSGKEKIAKSMRD